MRTIKSHNSRSGNNHHLQGTNTKRETADTVFQTYDIDNYEAYGAYASNAPDGDFTAWKYDPKDGLKN